MRQADDVRRHHGASIDYPYGLGVVLDRDDERKGAHAKPFVAYKLACLRVDEPRPCGTLTGSHFDENLHRVDTACPGLGRAPLNPQKPRLPPWLLPFRGLGGTIPASPGCARAGELEILITRCGR